MTQILLASTSRYRKTLLEKLSLPFSCVSPQVDESPYDNESASQLAARLAQAKASDVADKYRQQDYLIIGSDQVAELNGSLLGKPGTVERAVAQLAMCSNQLVTFHTGLCVINTTTQNVDTVVETYAVKFRRLTEQQIRNYIEKDQPLDCAGSFKCEDLGITLFEKMIGDDPNTLIGLPLIKLTELLHKQGVDVLAQ